MSGMITYEIKCPDATATEACADRLGQSLKGGEVIELIGDVGAGKTTFVRGLAKGLGSTDHVSSPTFTVSSVYNGRLKLHHLDLYRLDEPGLVSHQLAEYLQEPDSVAIIEWAGEISGVLPNERINIKFIVQAAEARQLQISVPKNLDYIEC